MKHRHDDLCGRAALLRVNVHWNTSAVISNGYRFIRVYRHRDCVAMTCERLVD